MTSDQPITIGVWCFASQSHLVFGVWPAYHICCFVFGHSHLMWGLWSFVGMFRSTDHVIKGYGQRGEDIMNEGSFGLWSVISESFRVLDVISWSWERRSLIVWWLVIRSDVEPLLKKKILLVSLLNVFENRSWLGLPFLGKNIYLFTLTIAKRYVNYRAALLGRPILEFAFDQWPFVWRGKRVWRSPLQIYPAIPGDRFFASKTALPTTPSNDANWNR